MVEGEEIAEERKIQEIRSDEVQEILSAVPNWTIRWGITVVLVILLGIIVLSVFVRYPDSIEAEVTVTTHTPPASIISKVDGKITQLMVKDREKVDAGSLLAVLENPAQFEDVILLNSLIPEPDSLLQFPSKLRDELHVRTFQIGEIRPSFNAFFKALEAYSRFKNMNFHENMVSGQREQLELLFFYYQRSINQIALLDEDYALAKDDFGRDSVLYGIGAISETEFLQSRQRLLQKNFELEKARSELTRTQMQMGQINKSIDELEGQLTNEGAQLIVELEQSYFNLQNDIDRWTDRFILKTPISGVVSFYQLWATNQYVKANEEVMIVAPVKLDSLRGNMLMPIQRSAKVQPGQQVNIKLHNYPYQEFGIVKGRVESISLVPRNGNYSVAISFPNGLITTYGKPLIFKQEMFGEAAIITEELSILERIFAQFRSIWSEKL